MTVGHCRTTRLLTVVAALVIVALARPVHATVIHTIVDEPLAADLALDVNGDGAPDFMLENVSGESHHFATAAFVVAPLEAAGGVAPAGNGDVVGPSTSFAPFFETGDVGCDFSGPVPACTGLPFHSVFFVALTFPDLGGDTHFGWMRIGLDGRLPTSETTALLFPTLIDYAWETQANTALTISAPAVAEPVPPYALALVLMLAAAMIRRVPRLDAR